ncbi:MULTISPECIES: hypothetical protein [Enterobacter cloacae complex]|uniref:Uncharacterized protein n=1 Tax=Enterobacter cloacae TaxID=550 RepID=A0A7H8UK02_ENTCL|nr:MULTISPECIES: hypothetical protein [Enterobacter cloacae complex]MDE4083253.1 hypothetical protein [Enterobacter pasteurii]QKZ99854.1 hypothetical protein HWQ14_20340 [Enterobacter cloacae]
MANDIIIQWQMLFPDNEGEDCLNNPKGTENIKRDEESSDKCLEAFSLVTEELFYLQQLISEVVTKKDLHESLKCHKKKGTKVLVVFFIIVVIFGLVVSIF